jgi:peroxisomal 2,4-dienoyl-CoA reductase
MRIQDIFKSNILNGRVALVTGGGSGIGREIAEQLAFFGCKVVVMGRRIQVLQETVRVIQSRGGQGAYITGDVRSEEDGRKVVEFCVSTFGSLDTLVNSAAGNFLAPADTITTKGFRTVLEIDTLGTFNMCKSALLELKKHGHAKIINISANLQFGATWWQSAPSAAKSAIDSLTRSLALEWGEYGIRVTGIAPGPIDDTEGMSKLSAYADEGSHLV